MSRAVTRPSRRVIPDTIPAASSPRYNLLIPPPPSTRTVRAAPRGQSDRLRVPADRWHVRTHDAENRILRDHRVDSVAAVSKHLPADLRRGPVRCGDDALSHGRNYLWSQFGRSGAK